MNRYLLLIFLSSWSSVVPLSLQCETGIAYPDHVLNIPHSLMANADVALLMTYQSEGVNGCMQDCCTEKYGSCTVVSFKKNVTENSCQHFNCRPIMKCRYLSSKMTDSFSFSSSPLPDVPSRHASKLSSSLATASSVPKTTNLDEHSMKDQQELGITKEAVATYSEEQFAMKNDNTTIKPRKGVEEFAYPPESATRSGSKPRKGVTMDDVVSNNTKSKVKPRKGVGVFVSETTTTSLTSVNELSTHSTYFSKNEHSSSSVSINSYSDAIANDLVSALEKVFEDDPDVTDVKVTSSSQVSSVESTPSYTSSVVQPSTTHSAEASSSTEQNYTPSDLQSSFSTRYIPPTSTVTPHLEHAATTTAQTADAGNSVYSQASSRSSISAEHSKLLSHGLSAEASTELADSVESEKERKYKSSMHLVLSLVFGLLVLFTVMGVVAKRVYDGWMRRHYRRMDFLIDGMYHGYE